MNKAVLVGNLTRDPELRTTSGDVSKCTFTIAINRRFTNAQGEREADFIPIVVWRQLADNCVKFLHKGSKVAVSGSIQVRNYETPDGTRRTFTEVVADEVQFINTQPFQQNTAGIPEGTPPPERRNVPPVMQPEPPIGGGAAEAADDDLPF
ncbi:MAG: single-stranded DNA-binding protein [Clostridia bacterium]|nr:single-stranded DNA-binding protein [Clostridia bacterium]